MIYQQLRVVAGDLRHVTTNLRSLVVSAYLRGAGLPLSWKNLWSYRSLQVKGTSVFLKQLMEPRLTSTDFRVTEPTDNDTMIVVAAFFIAKFPVYLQAQIRSMESIGTIDAMSEEEIMRTYGAHF